MFDPFSPDPTSESYIPALDVAVETESSKWKALLAKGRHGLGIGNGLGPASGSSAYAFAHLAGGPGHLPHPVSNSKPGAVAEIPRPAPNNTTSPNSKKRRISTEDVHVRLDVREREPLARDSAAAAARPATTSASPTSTPSTPKPPPSSWSRFSSKRL
ncbi:hypothetical protein MKEN_00153000 [Mycena kentingensis (nom. inval.)]|nr:hypothetical protein MKEN_00153000 [Mycena kentingensis (nom. inval.)]